MSHIPFEITHELLEPDCFFGSLRDLWDAAYSASVEDQDTLDWSLEHLDKGPLASKKTASKTE